MSNFHFLKKEWPQLYTQAREAEKHLLTAPRTAAFYSRLTLELTVYWLYDHDEDLGQRYLDETLFGLLQKPSFKQMLRPSMQRDLDYIRKIGNAAAHSAQAVSGEEAKEALKNVFRFMNWLARSYSANEAMPIHSWSDEHLPLGGSAQKELSRKELARLEKTFEDKQKTILKKLERLKKIEEENQRLKEENAQFKAQKERNRANMLKKGEEPGLAPEVRTEQQSRDLYINQMLREAGWNLKDSRQVVEEYTIHEMYPGRRGYADYVFFDKKGLPLAILEAKSITQDPEKGKEQAKLYADALERNTGRRPIIFLSNGLETTIIDDQFYKAERRILGFYSREELESLHYKHKNRKAIERVGPDPQIAGRPYQMQAVLSVNQALENRERAVLLSMATGSGKTRTAAALAKVLFENNWAKRILFLADRRTLVNQAQHAFKDHLENYSSISLLDKKEEGEEHARLVFSTYPTMLNYLNRTEERKFGIAQFDFIVVDEAHRSVYKKYKAIFDYFDAILIGLTATPQDQVDRNTYQLFHCPKNNPTFEYPLEEAVAANYLVPPIVIDGSTQITNEGVHYKDLSPAEKEEYEDKFMNEEEEEMPESIANSELDVRLFNAPTADKILNLLMEKGLKVDQGDKLGKTIIFAKNIKHAKFLKKRFDLLFPAQADLAETIYGNKDHVESLYDRFKDPKQLPQIAISVDMLDTGVDIPEIVNLVFYKKVRSHAKFWQMLGRGTRLSPDLFGPGQDKTFFYIFDVCDNVSFFAANFEKGQGSRSPSMEERAYKLKLEIAQALNHLDYQEDERFLAHQKALRDEAWQALMNLDQHQIEVKAIYPLYKKYEQRSRWDHLNSKELKEIVEELAPIAAQVDQDSDLGARRFDQMIWQLQLLFLKNKSRSKKANRLRESLDLLAQKGNIKQIREKAPLIRQLRQAGAIEALDFWGLEEARLELRELLRLLDKKQKQAIYSHFADELTGAEDREMQGYGGYSEPYKQRLYRLLTENKEQLYLQKLHSNQPLTLAEVEALESFILEQTQGKKEELKAEQGDLSLGRFIRSIIGLDPLAVQSAFADYLQDQKWNAQQLALVQLIVQHFVTNGYLRPQDIGEAPFNNQGSVVDLFGAQAKGLVDLIKAINKNTEPA